MINIYMLNRRPHNYIKNEKKVKMNMNIRPCLLLLGQVGSILDSEIIILKDGFVQEIREGGMKNA